MNLILLSGGSGKRLWPLSNEIRSKQFLKLFRNETDGSYESMVQRVYRQIMQTVPEASVTVTTGKKQKSAIQNQLGQKVGICVEPSRRDTFPAISIAAAYLQSERGLSADDIVIVCPVDPYVQTDYFSSLCRLEQALQSSGANLCLMGVKPTYPSEKYGYMIPETTQEAVRRVASFQEKPDADTAAAYIRQGALWNCGVFAFRLGYLLSIVRQHLDFDCYADIYAHYEELPKISFDYAVVEKEKNVTCIEFDGAWKDVGTWNTLAEEMAEPTLGNVVLSDTCRNVNVINELETPLLAMGVQNLIIAASADGIIVSDKTQSSFIKPYVDAMTQRVMYEEKSWGEFKILSLDENSMTVRLSIMAGKSMSYHRHHARREVWIVLSGRGNVTLDGQERQVAAGDVIQIPVNAQHTLTALETMELIEIQMGKINDKDIEK